MLTGRLILIDSIRNGRYVREAHLDQYPYISIIGPKPEWELDFLLLCGTKRETDHADMPHESYRLQVRLRRERRLPATPMLEPRTSALNHEIGSVTYYLRGTSPGIPILLNCKNAIRLAKANNKPLSQEKM